MKKILFMTAAAVLMAVLTACPNVDSTEKRVTGITISPAGAVSVAVGGTTTLTAAVTPADAANQTITWSSNNTGRATVNASTGVVTGVSAGAVTIRASAADGSGVFANKDITVTAAGTGKTVTVGAQGSALTAGTAGTSRFSLSGTNLAAPLTSGTIAWFSNAAGTTATTAPTGVSSGIQADMGSGTVSVAITTTTATPAGAYYFRVTVDGTQSNVATLTIAAAAPFSGAGTSASPYLIANATYLATMRDLINA